MLTVLDPRPYTARAAQLKVDYRLTNVAAELLAAALESKAYVHIAAFNMAPSWEAILRNSGVQLFLYERHEIPGLSDSLWGRCCWRCVLWGRGRRGLGSG